jgi:hypothetical protein
MKDEQMSGWVVETDPANEVGKELREVYAHAGMALDNAQTLEHVLKHFIVLAAAIEKRTSEPPTSTDDVARAIADLEKFEAEMSRQTLGRLIHCIKSQSRLVHSEELEANLDQSLKDRNRLAHHFFWDNALTQRRSQGRRNMADELKRIQAQFKRTIEDFEQANKALREYLGITKDMIDKAFAAAQAGATEEEIKMMVRQRRSETT